MSFDVGKQPCNDYKPHIEGNAYATWENIHECFAPFDLSHPCGGQVSFCMNCYSDHHSGGYDTCKGHPQEKTNGEDDE